ncbi:MAG TPA: hypothetical protein VJY54_10950 [Lachnospiraceae bacterium]|nr:hypothetical protein [Lachnospiraceae bacterium]
MSSFERKYGKYAIPNLSTMLILCYAVGYVIQLINNSFLDFLTLNPNQILHGQVWRLVTWVVVPPSTGNIFTTLIMLYFYWSIGSTLERTWGAYRYNVYIFSGILFTVIGSFIAMGLGYLVYGNVALMSIPENAAYVFSQGYRAFSTQYVNMSIFLAFAATFPDVQVLLMFIVPIKVKWMGIVYGVLIVWEFIAGAKATFTSLQGNLVLDLGLFVRIAILSSLLNFIVFFLTSRKHIIRSPKQMKRQHEFKKEVQRNANTVTKHKCAICGRTDETNPELEFRFCSKCNGNYEYCQDHLFTHEHIQ